MVFHNPINIQKINNSSTLSNNMKPISLVSPKPTSTGTYSHRIIIGANEL